jgi:hypothetical protein
MVIAWRAQEAVESPVLRVKKAKSTNDCLLHAYILSVLEKVNS